jgi:hypothetical protein
MMAEPMMQAETPEPSNAKAGGNPFLKDALLLVYESTQTYNALLKMLNKGKSNLPAAVGQATTFIVDQIEKDNGKPLTMEEMQSFAPGVTVAIYELAEKADLAKDVPKEDVIKAFGEAFKAWGKKYPDRIDKAKLSAMVNSENGQNFMKTMQQDNAQPQQPAQAMPPGLLEGR